MDKYLRLFLLANRWIKVKQDGLRLGDFIDKLGYRTVAIYGMGELGITLINEFGENGASLLYGIDRNASLIHASIDIRKPDDDWMPVELIIVTAVSEFNEIEITINKKINCAILSLEDILYEM